MRFPDPPRETTKTAKAIRARERRTINPRLERDLASKMRKLALRARSSKERTRSSSGGRRNSS